VSTFDPASLEQRIAQLETELNAPGLWDDQANAARVSAEHARVSRRLDGYRALQREYDDARELAEIDGGELDDEIAASLRPLRAELERLEEAALFDGEYDAGDAVVTLQSGTGGTDAQDWTEMMLRMYERWAATRGFDVELLEASPGEEAGLKSSTFTVGGENAYGILKAERGKHRLVRQSPYDAAHRRHTAFATVIVECQNERSQSANKQTAMRVLRARLVERAEEEREALLAKERGGSADTGFGGASIRSYYLHPTQLVKDTRTGYETGNAHGVLDGDLDPFIREYLLARAAGRIV